MKDIKRRSLVALSLLLAAGGVALPALASSHREAPFVARNPKADGTDFYMFNSYEPGREDYVTLVANYQPLQDGYGGPNFFNLDPDTFYEILIDNNGDAKEDLTFRFHFQPKLKDIALDVGGKKVSVPVVNVGPVSAGHTEAANVTESFDVSVIRGNRRGQALPVTNAKTGAPEFEKPLDYIGTKTFADYPAYAKSHIYDIKVPGCDMPGRLFAGQRKDPFVVNLGGTFDLVNIKDPLGAPDGGHDDLADKNVTAIELELPKHCLTSGKTPIIGAWTTAWMRSVRFLNGKAASFEAPDRNLGSFVQVSRLSNPLVNEVVIGLKDKDKFNASEPKDDAQFADYVTNPTLPAILELLFGGAGVKAPTQFPRTDLVAAFLTGVDGLNKNGSVAEMLRLNTSISAKAAGQQNNLGVIGGDTAGFPNGRRPGDDVVDIALRVMMGKLLPKEVAPSGQLPFTDGAKVDAGMFDSAFPYLKTPLPGAK